MRTTRWIAWMAAAALLAGCPAGDFDGDFGKLGGSSSPVAATLTVAQGSNLPADGTVNNFQQHVSLIQIRLEAQGGEDVTVDSIAVDFGGTAGLTAIDEASLYADMDDNGLFSQFFDTQLANTSSPAATTTFNGVSRTITAGTSENWIVVVDFNGSDAGGNTFNASFAGATAVTATGATSGDPVTVTGTAFAGREVTTQSIGTLNLSAGPANPADADIYGNETDHLMFHLTLTAGAVEDVDITSVRITHQGSGSMSPDVTTVRLIKDVNLNDVYDSGTDTELGSVSPSSHLIDFSISDTVTASGTNGWFVLYTFSGSASVGDDFQATLQANTDITAQGASTSQAAIVVGAPILGGTMTIPPGTLAVSAGAQMPAGGAVTPPATRAVLQITLSTTGSTEGVDISSITFVDIGGGALSNLQFAHLLVDNGATKGAYDAGGDTGIVLGMPVSNTTLTFNISPPYNLNPGTTEDWILVYDWTTGPGDYQATIHPAVHVAAQGAFSATPITASGSAVQGPVFNASGGGASMAWNSVAASWGPGAVIFSSGLHDPANNRFLVFGGSTSNSIFRGGTNDVYALSTGTVGGEAWTQLSPGGTSSPPPRWGHKVAYDPTHQYMYVFGGADNSGTGKGSTLSDVWRLSLSGGGNGTWSQVPTTGTAPARTLAAVAYDSSADRIIVFGGGDTAAGTGNLYGDTYQLDLNISPAPWTQVSTGGPTARKGSIGMISQASGVMMVFGGATSTSYVNETWFLNLSSWNWTPLSPTTPPSPRACMGRTYDNTNDKVYIFGGETAGGVKLNDVYAFDFSGPSWSQVSTTATPPSPRQGSALGWDGSNTRLLMHGGGAASFSNPDTLAGDTFYLQ